MAGKKVFKQGRKKEANLLNSRAEVFYHRQWDIISLADVEQDNEGEYPDEDRKLNSAHLMDYMGVDKIVEVDDPHQIITVAQRFITHESPSHDFMLRTSTGTSMAAEKSKFLSGLHGHGSFPSVYAHAKAWECGTDFEHFHLIDFKKMLKKINSGELKRSGHYKNPRDGTACEYYEIEKIREKECIIQSWGEGWKE